MVAVRKIQNAVQHAAVVPSAPIAELGRVLEARSGLIANYWRRRFYESDAAATRSIGQIEGILDALVAEIGRSVQSESDSPLTAWARTHGVLRLSIGAGPEGLTQEFDLLRGALEQVAEQLHSPPAQRRRMRAVLDACQAAALIRMREARGDASRMAPVPFGGLVTETL